MDALDAFNITDKAMKYGSFGSLKSDNYQINSDTREREEKAYVLNLGDVELRVSKFYSEDGEDSDDEYGFSYGLSSEAPFSKRQLLIKIKTYIK